jgi:hypothetical protein
VAGKETPGLDGIVVRVERVRRRHEKPPFQLSDLVTCPTCQRNFLSKRGMTMHCRQAHASGDKLNGQAVGANLGG